MRGYLLILFTPRADVSRFLFALRNLDNISQLALVNNKTETTTLKDRKRKSVLLLGRGT